MYASLLQGPSCLLNTGQSCGNLDFSWQEERNWSSSWIYSKERIDSKTPWRCTVNMEFTKCYLIFMGIFCFVVHNLYRICIFIESCNLNVIENRGAGQNKQVEGRAFWICTIHNSHIFLCWHQNNFFSGSETKRK